MIYNWGSYHWQLYNVCNELTNILLYRIKLKSGWWGISYDHLSEVTTDNEYVRFYLTISLTSKSHGCVIHLHISLSLPNIKLQMALRATLMFWNEPRMCILLWKQHKQQNDVICLPTRLTHFTL